MKLVNFPLIATLFVFLSDRAHGDKNEAAPSRPKIMVVGVYHFVSKANVYSMSVDDPLSPERQAQIKDVVTHLAKFQPTKVVLEEKAGTSDLEANYQNYLQNSFELPAGETYQIGFRLARSVGSKKIYLITAWTDFDWPGLKQYADSHGQTQLLEKTEDLFKSLSAPAESVQKNGTVLDILRYYNSEQAIRLNNSSYMYITRIGDSENYGGAKLVASSHLRNLEMFANLTRLIERPNERIVVLYGQGHEFLMKQFVQESPDLELVDALDFL
jgi:Family of unknown function (DUF5694)